MGVVTESFDSLDAIADMLLRVSYDRIEVKNMASLTSADQ